MTRLRALALGVWEFVVGDDWVTALGVVVALGVTAIVAGAGGTAWWMMPVAVSRCWSCRSGALRGSPPSGGRRLCLDDPRAAELDHGVPPGVELAGPGVTVL